MHNYYTFESIDNLIESIVNNSSTPISLKIYDINILNILSLITKDALYTLNIDETTFLSIISIKDNYDSFSLTIRTLLNSVLIVLQKNNMIENYENIIHNIGIHRIYEIKLKIMIRISYIYNEYIGVDKCIRYELFREGLKLKIKDHDILEYTVLQIMNFISDSRDLNLLMDFLMDIYSIYVTYLIVILKYSPNSILLDLLLNSNLEFTFDIFIKYVKKIKIDYIIKYSSENMINTNFFKKIVKKYIPTLFKKIKEELT